MAQSKVSEPISIILDDSNYRLWSSAMQRFLRARKLWKYITGDTQPPHFSETDDDDETLHIQYQTHLEDWDSVNSKIITWFSNTLVSSIHSLFYSIRDCQGSQTLTDFYNKLSNLWNHLAQFEPTWTCPTNVAAFYAYRDRSRLCHFLMALPPDYEHIRLLFFIAIHFLQLAKLLPNSDLRRLARRLWFISILSLFWRHLSGHHYNHHLSLFGFLARNICHLDLRRNIAAFVDETLTLMKIVALAPSPNARGTTTVRLLLSLTLLDRLLTLLLPPLLLLMSRP
ncbi:hypothetical protein Acr_14g0005940 [Actinidia rufa]|uniref:Retrotransposon Copia-like N-terminal domain-containing protein n=1 Tax=Actinidia rufa TaxID=165716 RepID=A0A7J0FQF9_9ERIC|nr:hypothetical protein Acr_14g0005940 [Actinidia rufa]